MDHGGPSEMEGKVMSQVQGGRDNLCDNLPATEPLTAQTGNLNETSALSQNLSLLQKGESGEQGLFHNAPLTKMGGSRHEEEEKEGSAEENRDNEEEDLDEVMKEEDEEEEDVSEGSSSIICCQSQDTPMTDSSYSETASLLETPCPFSPGTSPEPTSPVIPTATPETLCPISQASQSQSVVSVKPLTSNAESFSSRTGSVPGVESLTTWPADPPTLTSHCSSPCPPDPTCITERSTSSTQSVTEFFTSPAAAFTVMADTTKLGAFAGCAPESAATGPSPRLSLDSTNATAQGASEDISGPMCDTGHVPDQDLLTSLAELAQRGDDAHLPQYLHQIAEAFVLKENFQWALWCIQLERLYHQRVLHNLNVLQGQWESQSKPTSSEPAAQHLDSLKHICQTHSRPRAKDAATVSLGLLRSTAEGGGKLSPHISDDQVDERMEARDEDSSHSESSHPILTSCETANVVVSPDITKMKQQDPEREIVGREGFHKSQLTDSGGGEAGEAVGSTISALRDELPPSTSAALDQPEPAEQQGGDRCLTQERQAKKEDGQSRQEKAVPALKIDVEGEDGEEEKLKQKALQVETIASGTEVEQEPLHPKAPAEKSQQESSESLVEEEAGLPPDEHMKQQEQEDLDEEEYELEDADIIREASTLDDLAKLITVEEISPVSGLVSILKRRSEPADRESAPMNTVTRSSTSSTKRRVRFKFPDDSYEQDVGGGDSCLLLFLLCLVTVVISLGGTALYCALGDVHSSVCQDFSRNADFYMNQIQRGISHIQHWFGPGS